MKQRNMKRVQRFLWTFLTVMCTVGIVRNTVQPLVCSAAQTQAQEIQASVKLKKNSSQSKISVTVSELRD